MPTQALEISRRVVEKTLAAEAKCTLKIRCNTRSGRFEIRDESTRIVGGLKTRREALDLLSAIGGMQSMPIKTEWPMHPDAIISQE